MKRKSEKADMAGALAGGQTPVSLKATRGPDPTPVLLAAKRNADEVRAILSAYGLRDLDQADCNLTAMAGDPIQRRQLADILPMLMESISRTADPDQALNHWERMLGSVSRTSFLDYLRNWPRMLDLLCVIFGNSDALTVTLLRDPTLVYWLAEENVLSKPPTRKGMERALRKSIGHLASKEVKLDALRRFRRREMLRIGVRDLLRLATVPETTGLLSDLACLMIHAAYEIVDADLKQQYGVPMHRNKRRQWRETQFAVIGMGKLGGHELNYSSDVDLLYIYESDDGETRVQGRARADTPAGVGISNEEYFEILSRELTRVLTVPTREGHVFRVDLRLRAEGSVGQLARSLAGYQRYYLIRGQVWERLALLKAWPVAGSPELGRAFVRAVRPFIFGDGKKPPDFAEASAVIEEVRAVKAMIDGKMAGRGHERRNVKLGTGGIREIEFFVQTLQVLAGKQLPAVVDRSTLGALERFARWKLISDQEKDDLTVAYVFLRDVEHKLQMAHDLQTHSLPEEEDELERCAIRMGYGTDDRTKAAAFFLSDHRRYTTVVHRAFRALFSEPKTSPALGAVLRAIRTALGKRRLRNTKGPVVTHRALCSRRL